MKVVVIDDELDGRQIIERRLRKIDGIELVESADSVDSGLTLISKIAPDLVFLDVEMPGRQGFELLEVFDKINFKVVFVTAYSQYAIKAIKFKAFDYLLKPVSTEELKETVERVKSAMYQEKSSALILEDDNKVKSKLAIHSVSSVQYVEISSIVRFQADGNYTNVFLLDGQRLVSTKLLKEYEELIEGAGFFRIHRSHLINLRCVQEYRRKSKDYVVLSDGTEIEVARQRKALFLSVMEQF